MVWRWRSNPAGQASAPEAVRELFRRVMAAYDDIRKDKMMTERIGLLAPTAA